MGLREYFKTHPKVSAFIEGMGSLRLFGGPSYKPYWMKDNLTPQEQDALAIRGDWEKVGEDLRISMDNFEKSLPNDKYKELLSNRKYKKSLFSKLEVGKLIEISKN